MTPSADVVIGGPDDGLPAGLMAGQGAQAHRPAPLSGHYVLGMAEEQSTTTTETPDTLSWPGSVANPRRTQL